MDDTLLRAFLTLMACVAAIGLVLWWVKRKTSRARVGEEELSVRILARQALSPKANVSIVHIANRTLLLGVTEQSVSLLAELSTEAQSVPQSSNQTFAANQAYGTAPGSSTTTERGTYLGDPPMTHPPYQSPPPHQRFSQPQHGHNPLDPIQPAYGVPAPLTVPDLSVGGYLKSLFTRSK